MAPAVIDQRVRPRSAAAALEILRCHRGFVVAAINHTYFTEFVSCPDGRLITGRGFVLDNDPAITPAEEALLADAQDLWSDDQIFVLEQLISLDQDSLSGFAGRLDLSRVAAAGFSFGGASAYKAASKDPCIRAVVDGGVAHVGIEDQSLWWRWDFPALNPFGPRGGQDALRSIGLVSGDFLRKYLDGDSTNA